MKHLFALITLSCALSFSVTSIAADTKMLTYHFFNEPKNLDWSKVYGTYKWHFTNSIMNGLVSVGQTATPDPELAESWTASADNKIFTFNLRKKVLWTDGVELTANQFVESWRYLLEKKNLNDDTHFLFDIIGAEEYADGAIKDPKKIGIEAPSKYVLKVRLKNSNAQFPTLLSHAIFLPLRVDLIRKYGSAWHDPKNLQTLGAYTVKQWVRGKYIELKANPKYFKGKTETETVRILFESNRDKLVDLFKSGDLDIFDEVSPEELLQIKVTGTPHKEYNQTLYKVVYVGFNFKSEKLKDPNIRRAIAHAIDKKDLVQQIDNSYKVAHSIIPFGVPGSSDTPLIEFNLSKAKEGLSTSPEKAKIDQGLQFVTGNPMGLLVGKALSKILKRNLGINLNPTKHESTDIGDVLKKGEFDIVWGFWFADPAPYNFLLPFVSFSAVNKIFYKNSEYDHFVEMGKTAINTKEAVENYKVAQQILISNDVAVLPLFYVNQRVLLSPKVKNFQMSPQGFIQFSQISKK